MRMKKTWINRRIILFGFIIIIVCYFIIYSSIITIRQPYVPLVRIRSSENITSKKIAVVYYTTTFGVRTDSHSQRFDPNLQPVCEIIDPEEYPYADGVIVSLHDFARFPTLSYSKHLYREKYQSQLWLLHTEESARKSYETAEINSVTDLDDWFNLTATLKPESDLHIQYKGYRIKPEIIDLAQTKLKLTFNRTLSSPHLPRSDLFHNGTSVYFSTLALALNKEFHNRQNHYSNVCPYTCNQPLPSHLIQSLQPYLKPIIPHVLNHDTVYIAWFVSNCDSHSGREEYVSKLRSQPGIRVDIYGKCSSMWNSHILPIKCEKGPSDCMNKTLLHYRFYLSFENSKCDTYITEKYWMQGLNGHTVPIVLGAKREQYKRIAVPHSYIHVDDYATVEQLAKELRRLNKNDSEYIKYLQWTQLYDVGDDYPPMLSYDMFSTLCLLGHYVRLHAMKANNEQRSYLLKRIRDIFDIRQVRLPNFNWETATTKLIRISEFYNPKVNCWDNDYPSFPRRAYNFLFSWWKFF